MKRFADSCRPQLAESQKNTSAVRNSIGKIEMASLTPALTVDSYGCFLPDLTRFTTPQCGETRRREY